MLEIIYGIFVKSQFVISRKIWHMASLITWRSTARTTCKLLLRMGRRLPRITENRLYRVRCRPDEGVPAYFPTALSENSTPSITPSAMPSTGKALFFSNSRTVSAVLSVKRSLKEVVRK